MKKLVLTILGILSLLGRLPAAAKPYPNARFLMETVELTQRLAEPNLRIVDMRQPRARYEANHIPGAVYFDVKLTKASRNGVPGMLPQLSKLEEVLGALGIDNDTQVVIYDNQGGLQASRLFWTLEYMGHTRMALLNGGIVKWRAEGRQLSTEVPQPVRRTFIAKRQPQRLVDAAWIKERLGSSTLALVDARTTGEFAGTTVRAARGGHIPGARNIEWKQNVQLNQDTRFKPASELLSMYRQKGITPDKVAVPYCQTFHRAAQTYFTLRLLGFERVAGYDGSWAEWGNRVDLPIETGREM